MRWPFVQELKDNSDEILWRPMHEMNQKFLVGRRPGAEGTAKLSRMLHDYLTHEKKLDNLIWVWDIQDFGTLADNQKPQSG